MRSSSYFNHTPSFQSFMEIRLERSKMVLILDGVDGPSEELLALAPDVILASASPSVQGDPHVPIRGSSVHTGQPEVKGKAREFVRRDYAPRRGPPDSDLVAGNVGGLLQQVMETSLTETDTKAQ